MSRGRIEVITGCMFSGKSSELVRRLRRAQIARRGVVVVKHASDDRYDARAICSHNGSKLEAVPAQTVQDIERAVRATLGCEVVGIDEAQFYGDELVILCEELANNGDGVRVIVAGLEQDSDAKPFGPIPALMVVAEEVTKLSAVCVVCGEPATRSYHKAGKAEQVEVGAAQYEARCRHCWLDGR